MEKGHSLKQQPAKRNESMIPNPLSICNDPQKDVTMNADSSIFIQFLKSRLWEIQALENVVCLIANLALPIIFY